MQDIDYYIDMIARVLAYKQACLEEIGISATARNIMTLYNGSLNNDWTGNDIYVVVMMRIIAIVLWILCRFIYFILFG